MWLQIVGVIVYNTTLLYLFHTESVAYGQILIAFFFETLLLPFSLYIQYQASNRMLAEKLPNNRRLDKRLRHIPLPQHTETRIGGRRLRTLLYFYSGINLALWLFLFSFLNSSAIIEIDIHILINICTIQLITFILLPYLVTKYGEKKIFTRGMFRKHLYRSFVPTVTIFFILVLNSNEVFMSSINNLIIILLVFCFKKHVT